MQQSFEVIRHNTDYAALFLRGDGPIMQVQFEREAFADHGYDAPLPTMADAWTEIGSGDRAPEWAEQAFNRANREALIEAALLVQRREALREACEAHGV